MNSAKASLMITLFAILSKSDKHYICPAMNTVINLLDNFHGLSIKRRWLFQCMRYLLDERYITKKKRYQRMSDGQVYQIPSMISITMKGLKFLVQKKVIGAQQLLIRMLNWMKKKDDRFPKEEDLTRPPTDEQRQLNVARLRTLLEFT